MKIVIRILTQINFLDFRTYSIFIYNNNITDIHDTIMMTHNIIIYYTYNIEQKNLTIIIVSNIDYSI